MTDLKSNMFPEPTPTPKPVWDRRWRVICATLCFCAALIAYVAVLGADDRVREAALLGAFSLAGAVVLGFIGFAVQDDRNWMKTFDSAASDPRNGRGDGR